MRERREARLTGEEEGETVLSHLLPLIKLAAGREIRERRAEKMAA
jgi:hypothetical protein